MDNQQYRTRISEDSKELSETHGKKRHFLKRMADFHVLETKASIQKNNDQKVETASQHKVLTPLMPKWVGGVPDTQHRRHPHHSHRTPTPEAATARSCRLAPAAGTPGEVWQRPREPLQVRPRLVQGSGSVVCGLGGAGPGLCSSSAGWRDAACPSATGIFHKSLPSFSVSVFLIKKIGS